MNSWNDEPWARHISALSHRDRTALVSAASLILKHEGHLSDALESELDVFLECARGTDIDGGKR